MILHKLKFSLLIQLSHIEKLLQLNQTKFVWLNLQTNITEYMLKLNHSKKVYLKLLKITQLDLRMIQKKDQRNSMKNSDGIENMEELSFGVLVQRTQELTY